MLVTTASPVARVKTPIPIEQEAGWAQKRFRTRYNILQISGFEHSTIQPVASRYTD